MLFNTFSLSEFSFNDTYFIIEKIFHSIKTNSLIQRYRTGTITPMKLNLESIDLNRLKQINVLKIPTELW